MSAARDHLSLPSLRLVNRVCNTFEQSWRSGERPHIADFLADHAEPLRSHLLRELLSLDIEYRLAAGETPRRADYDDLIQHDDPLFEETLQRVQQYLHESDDERALRPNPPWQLDRFTLLEKLGDGGFGSVWKAHDPKLDRTVALKIPRSPVATLEDEQRFEREARAAAQLRHPGVVQLYEFGRTDDHFYLVSEYVEGVTLDQWHDEASLPGRETARLIQQIAEAVAHAHAAGVVHRDLKPGNIIVGRDGQPHLTDFGLAKRAGGETVTMPNVVAGTPAYMSPEQASGESRSADARSDIYALGVLLYELLTGEPPFRGHTHAVVRQILDREPVAPRQLNDSVPPDLQTIALRCLEKEPTRRYQTAQEVADELGRFLRREPIHARPVGHAERSWRWCRRNPVVAGLVAAVAVSLLAGTVVSSILALRASRSAALAEKEAARASVQEERAKEETTRAQQASALATERMEAWQRAARNLQYQSVTPLLGINDFRARQQLANGDIFPDEHRDFAWRYFEAATRRHIRVEGRLPERALPYYLAGHPIYRTLTVSPDGHVLAAVPKGTATIVLWSTQNREVIRTIATGHEAPIIALCYSLDGTWLAAGDVAGRVTLLDASGQASPRTLAAGDGRIVANVLNDSHRPNVCVREMTFSPDSKLLAVGVHHSVAPLSIYRVGDGQLQQELKPTATGPVQAISWSADGGRIAAGMRSPRGQLINVWELPAGEPTAFLTGDRMNLFDLHFAPDGQSVTTICENRTRHWTIEGEPAGWRMAPGGWYAAYSPDGNHLAVVTYNVVEILDAARGEVVARIDPDVPFFPMACWTDDGSTLRVADIEGRAYRWSAAPAPLWNETQLADASNHYLHPLPDDAGFIAYSPSGDSWITRRGRTGEVVAEFHRRPSKLFPSDIGWHGVAIADDGKRLTAVTDVQDVRCWDVASTKELWHWHWDSSSSNGQYWWTILACELCRFRERDAVAVAVIASGEDEPDAIPGATVVLLDLETGEELRRLVSNRWRSLLLDWNRVRNCLAACDQDGRITVWSMDTAERVADMQSPGETWHTCLQFSRSGQRLYGANRTGHVEVWNAEDWSLLSKQRVSDSSVHQVLPLPDDSTLLAVLGERVLLLDAKTAVLRGDMRLPYTVKQAYLDEDDRLWFRTDTDGFILRLRIPEQPNGELHFAAPVAK